MIYDAHEMIHGAGSDIRRPRGNIRSLEVVYDAHEAVFAAGDYSKQDRPYEPTARKPRLAVYRAHAGRLANSKNRNVKV